MWLAGTGLAAAMRLAGLWRGGFALGPGHPQRWPAQSSGGPEALRGAQKPRTDVGPRARRCPRGITCGCARVDPKMLGLAEVLEAG